MFAELGCVMRCMLDLLDETATYNNDWKRCSAANSWAQAAAGRAVRQRTLHRSAAPTPAQLGIAFGKRIKQDKPPTSEPKVPPVQLSASHCTVIAGCERDHLFGGMRH